MKISFLIISNYLIFNTFLACSQPAGTDKMPIYDAAYQLVWQDEFEEEGKPDPTHWNFEEGFVRNNEHQWYQPENAVCKDGFLIIEARKEQKPNPNYKPESDNWKESREYIEYTSSSLRTRGLHAWQYGRFEIRAKIDTSPGRWPAFWTLGEKGSWPACGEIDIMEYYRGMILANAAWAGPEGKTMWDDLKKDVGSFNDPNWSNEFHIWRMDWDETAIKLYVDDILLNTIELEKTVNQRGDIKNPMKQPHYIIVNLAIGGNNGGDPSSTMFPRSYVVDYVRVYQ
jgi:beta-glucanase (GH16 family)